MRKFFKKLGAEISSEKSNKGVEDDLHKIIGVCDVCFKDGEPAQIDGILNSIVSIMITVSRRRLLISRVLEYNSFMHCRFHWTEAKTLCWPIAKK